MRLSQHEATGHQVRSIINYQLLELSEWLKTRQRDPGSLGTKAHYQALVNDISKFLEEPADYEPIAPLTPPAGSPIGMCDY